MKGGGIPGKKTKGRKKKNDKNDWVFIRRRRMKKERHQASVPLVLTTERVF
jgi:hypothetical protein